MLLHASLHHPLICPLQGVLIDEEAGLLLLLLPRRPYTLQRWDRHAAAFVVASEQLQQQQQQQQEGEEETHQCGDTQGCACMPVLLYTEDGARQLLKQVGIVSSRHLLYVSFPVSLVSSGVSVFCCSWFWVSPPCMHCEWFIRTSSPLTSSCVAVSPAVGRSYCLCCLLPAAAPAIRGPLSPTAAAAAAAGRGLHLLLLLVQQLLQQEETAGETERNAAVSISVSGHLSVSSDYACCVWIPPMGRRGPRGGDTGNIPDGDGPFVSETEGDGDSSGEDEEEGTTAGDAFLFSATPTLTIPESLLQPLRAALKQTDVCPLPAAPFVAGSSLLQANGAAATAAGSLPGIASEVQRRERQTSLATALRDGLLDDAAFPRDSSSGSEDAGSSSSSEGAREQQQEQQQQQQQQQEAHGGRKRARETQRRGGEHDAPLCVSSSSVGGAAADEAAGDGGERDSSSSSSSSSSSNSSSSSSSNSSSSSGLGDSEVLLQLTDFNSAAVADDDACTIWDAGMCLLSPLCPRLSVLCLLSVSY